MSTDTVSEDAPQLPRGRHGLPRGAVVEHQRRRLLRAVPAAVNAKGYPALTVEDISAQARVSRRTFYENFHDKEDCFISSYRVHTDELIAVVAAAASVARDWRQQLKFALDALLRFLARRPALARMAVIEVMSAGPVAIEERDRAVSLLSSLIGDQMFTAVRDPSPALLLDVIAGAALQLVSSYVLAGQADELERLHPTLMYLGLVALDGPSVAARRAGVLSGASTEE